MGTVLFSETVWASLEKLCFNQLTTRIRQKRLNLLICFSKLIFERYSRSIHRAYLLQLKQTNSKNFKIDLPVKVGVHFCVHLNESKKWTAQVQCSPWMQLPPPPPVVGNVRCSIYLLHCNMLTLFALSLMAFPSRHSASSLQTEVRFGKKEVHSPRHSFM